MLFSTWLKATCLAQDRPDLALSASCN